MRLEIINEPMSITELYDCVAKVMGYDPSQCEYDCTKIMVANNIADNVEQYYFSKDGDTMSFGMAWVCYGPKADDTLPENTVEVEEGFIVK